MKHEMNSDEMHRHFAAKFFNDAWALLKKATRTPAEDDRMIHLAHASRLHWGFIGSAQNLAVGEWQIARVYSELKRCEPALYHANRCVEIAEKNEFDGFFLASAYEGMARATAICGDPSASGFFRKAQEIAAGLTDPEQKAILQADLSTIRLAS